MNLWIDPFEDRVGARGLDHQVEVVTHQAPGVHLPVGLPASLAEGLQEQLAVFGGVKDWLAMVTARPVSG